MQVVQKNERLLSGRVAIVTGAGRGIGRGIARLLARHGASVVVNDLGSAADGGGTDSDVAQDVVDEITAAGGQAVASHDSVADFDGAAAIVARAVDAFGRADILVNNAGVLRDRMVFNLSEDDWDVVVGVHLKGSFNTIRHVAPHMRAQRWGRIVNFTSTSGLIGNLGQANYAAAKMGVVGLTKVTALDLERYGVTANAIAPFAWTRLTAGIPEDDPKASSRVSRLKAMDADLVAPLVAYLASDAGGDVTGQVFAVRGKELALFGHPRPVRFVQSTGDWSTATVGRMVAGPLRSAFAPLEVTDDVFHYDPPA